MVHGPLKCPDWLIPDFSGVTSKINVATEGTVRSAETKFDHSLFGTVHGAEVLP